MLVRALLVMHSAGRAGALPPQATHKHAPALRAPAQVRDMAEQACLDAASALDELEGLLGLLGAPDTSLDEPTCVAQCWC